MKIICVGRNYSAHARELNNPVNDEPVIFLKPDTCQLQEKQPFFIPDIDGEIHHEAEIVVKISKMGKNIQEKFASSYYEEISFGIDFTARDLQSKLKSKGLPWELAKSFDHSAPVGTFINKNSIDDVSNMPFHLLVNGKMVQQGNSSKMIFSIDHIISFVSRYITLKPGDLIFTGTPEGVGPVKAGDVLEGFIAEKQLLTLKVK